ncbi:MAG TPA: hypothetical protein VFZ43_07255 [Anaerolineales bacterium]
MIFKTILQFMISERRQKLLPYPSYNDQNIGYDDSNQSDHAKDLLPNFPSDPVLHSFEEEFSKWIERRAAGKAIVNVLVILIRLEPESVRVVKEYSAKQEKRKNKGEWKLIHDLELRLFHNNIITRMASYTRTACWIGS